MWFFFSVPKLFALPEAHFAAKFGFELEQNNLLYEFGFELEQKENLFLYDHTSSNDQIMIFLFSKISNFSKDI